MSLYFDKMSMLDPNIPLFDQLNNRKVVHQDIQMSVHLNILRYYLHMEQLEHLKDKKVE